MMTHPTVERKYALKRIKAGDYLLVGNDDKTLWRIRTYEDGPSHGLDSMPRDREFWGVWKSLDGFEIGKGIDLDAWDRWDAWDLSMYGKREEAIQAALRAESAKPKPKARKDSRPLGALLLDRAKR